VEAASVPWRPLGRLLVEKGLLNGEQLERALDEQAVSGRRLGEILVELGFVTRSHLSLTLAEQYGFELTAETGFGTGLRAVIERRQDADRPPQAGGAPGASGPVLALVPAPEPDEELEPADDPLHLAQLEEQWAKLAAAEASLADALRELAHWRRAAERKRAQVERLLGRLRTRERAAPAPVHADAHGHLVLALLGDRYELVEREGPPPAAGAPVELPELGGSFVVERVGRSPLPNDPRRCAVAQAR